jgi:hypothetical protein
MADQLATPEDLASLLERDDMDLYKATMLVECATAVVQEAAGGQRIVEVLGDTVELLGTVGAALFLPQLPVTAITSVTLDGEAVAQGTTSGTWRRPGTSWLWRDLGWAAVAGEPSSVVVVYDHGFAAGDQRLQLARSATLGLLRGVFGNAEGATEIKIDDYAAAYDALSARMETSPHLRRALLRTYGRTAGLVKLGGI